MLFGKLTGNVLMSNQSTKSARLLLGVALTSLLLVSACDRQSERLERAREIADASLKQITGETVVEPAAKPDPMRSVPVEARAIAGKVISDISGKPTDRPAFAVLSVIAKPADIPPAEAMAEIEDGELYLEDESVLADVMAEGPSAPVAAAPAPAPGSESAARA